MLRLIGDSCPSCVTAVLLILSIARSISAAEWQWSIPDGNARAFLWIPPDCKFVRGVVLANHNMIEQGILEHPTMRAALGSLGFAQVWIVPKLEMEFDFHKGAGEHFHRVMDALALASGYEELRSAPVVPMGHSACATFPWNFAAWNPARTLCVLSIHGDAPKTTLTGYGRPNVNWEGRDIDGVPGLMVMSEQEWWEDRLTPAITFRRENPKAPIALFADVGRGHFDFSDELVKFLAMFIRKAAEQRLPERMPSSDDAAVELRPVDPAAGWLMDRWRKDQAPVAPAAAFAAYTGPKHEAFWCFDQEMADEAERLYASGRGKRPQMIAFVQDDQLHAGEPCSPAFVPLEDGISFRLGARFLDSVQGNGANLEKWSGLPKGSSLGHSDVAPIRITKIVGPVEILEPGSLRLRLDRSIYTEDRRNHDAWILASHPGDAQYQSTVQQAMIRMTPNTKGKPQTITFPKINDVIETTAEIQLAAKSDAGLPVHYFVLEGPAEVEGGILKLKPIPPRARFPVRVTVVAWQWGLPDSAPHGPIQTAQRVEQTFDIHATK